MMGHMSYTLRRIMKQHWQLDLHYMLPEVLPEVKNILLWWMIIFILINMIENVNILFILILKFQQGVK